MPRQDLLWKAVIEGFFLDLLDFFYAEYVPQMDLSRGFEFLDKELTQLYADSAEENRRADKLVKIFLKDGTEQWLLVHIEVQGYQDENFARRMFTTYYQAVDKFNKPVEALVIYTDRPKKNHFSFYESKGLKTTLRYDFNSFEITAFTEEEYEAMDNPFAIIFQTALLGSKRNWKDEELLQTKMVLFRKLLEKGYSKQKIRDLADFIKVYVTFSDKEFSRKFEELADVSIENSKNMGIQETIRFIYKEEAKKIQTEKILLVNRLETLFKYLQTSIDYKVVADVEKLKEDFVQEFKALMTEKSLKKLKNQVIKFYDGLDVETPKPKEEVQKQLITLFLPYQFSDKALASFFRVRPSTVKIIRASETKK